MALSIDQIPEKEAKLLERIKECLPEAIWSQYEALIAKRDAETLTFLEQKRLIGLIDTIELDHARRIGCLVELANLRDTTLEQLMDTLGIARPTFV